jgi:twinkle protein
MTSNLSAAATKWFQSRGLDPDTVTRYGVSTQKQGDMGEVIAFPFVENGRTVNHKYRGREKSFRQDVGAIKCFWNHDALLDPSLYDGSQRLVITEGELDALTAIQCGYSLTVSVPDGAPAQISDGPIDPEHDKKFSFVFRAWETLKKIKKIILAVDNDGPGQVLANELVRRLGAWRCLFVTYPDGCKDLNEVLQEHGSVGVVSVLTGAKLWPVKGLYRLSDYPEAGEIQTYSTGWPALDHNLRIVRGEFMVVTGIPGHGKSAWLNCLAMNLARKEDWRITIGSFETRVRPVLLRDLRAFHGGAPWEADDFIERNFSFIDQKPLNDDEDADIDWVLERAADSVVRHGCDMLILDPWNEIEHKRRRDESETDYVSRAIRTIKRFALNFDVMVAVVAHPQKMNVGRQGAVQEPTMYDISGSANWYNKADHGIVLHRPSLNSNLVNVMIKKVKIKPEMGQEGLVQFEFDLARRRFLDTQESLLLQSGA